MVQLIQQWPPAQKSVQVTADDDDDSGGIDLDKARERLQEEDKFDKDLYRKKIKEKHRVSQACSYCLGELPRTPKFHTWTHFHLLHYVYKYSVFMTWTSLCEPVSSCRKGQTAGLPFIPALHLLWDGQIWLGKSFIAFCLPHDLPGSNVTGTAWHRNGDHITQLIYFFISYIFILPFCGLLSFFKEAHNKQNTVLQVIKQAKMQIVK